MRSGRVIVLIAGLVLANQHVVGASGGTDKCPPVSSDDAIHACVEVEGSGEDRPVPDRAPVRPCRWVAASYSQSGLDTLIDPTTQADDGTSYYRLTNGGLGRTLTDGTTQKAMRQHCDDDNTIGPLVWSTVTTIADLIAASLLTATRQIPTPTLDINPTPQTGGVVNLGLWLAITNTPPISVQAGTPTTWARTTAQLTTTTWNMGNGDTITCTGTGTPLHPNHPGWNDTTQGPCGYTYTQHPPPEPYHASVTATWTITWTTSTGTTGTTTPITRTTNYDYTVIEIHTIGVKG
jgi:hypothetical protein